MCPMQVGLKSLVYMRSNIMADISIDTLSLPIPPFFCTTHNSIYSENLTGKSQIASGNLSSVGNQEILIFKYDNLPHRDLLLMHYITRSPYLNVLIVYISARQLCSQLIRGHYYHAYQYANHGLGFSIISRIVLTFCFFSHMVPLSPSISIYIVRTYTAVCLGLLRIRNILPSHNFAVSL